MATEDAALGLIAFLEEVGDAPEILWAASLAALSGALAEAERLPRFRHYPGGHLRRLRRDVARAMRLARLAVALQEAETERDREIDADLAERAAVAARGARRAQTLPAELARLENARRRREGLPIENFHLRADYPA